MIRRKMPEGSVTIFMTWDQALASYAIFLGASCGSEGTRRLRMNHAKRFSRLADLPRLINAEMLMNMMNADHLEPESRSSLRASAKKLFGWMLDEGIVDVDPSARLPKITVPSGSPRPAPENVVTTAILAADERTRAMLMLGAYAGLRCCEIARLNHDQIVGDTLRIVGKGGKVRIVPLHPVIATALPTGIGFVFPGNDEGHLSPLWVCKILGKALPKGWSGHTLRHRFATQAYSVDRDILAVQQLLGHSKPETTARYTLITNDALSRAVFAAGPQEAA